MGRLQPKYRQLTEYLLEQIDSGKWGPGERLPSEPMLAAELGAAYMTLRKAISELVQSGRLYRIRGRGTFVAEPKEVDDRPTLGLLLIHEWHSIDPFYFPGVVAGFVRRANELGFRVHLEDRSEPLVEFLEFRKLRVRAVACILLEKDDLMDADALLDSGVMVVAINHYGGSRRIPSVSPANREASYEMTRRLIELGHRRFAFLAGPTLNFDASERRRGVLSAAQLAGLPADSITQWFAGFEEPGGYEAGKRILASGDLPTAVIAASDLTAVGLMKAFLEAGVRIPADVSVVGFGDFRLSGYVHPALTTVHLPLDDIGRQAAEALVALYRGIRVDPIRLTCPVVWRESAAPCPGN